ncbi:hypothetical protein [Campylobacter sp. MIT 12-5580]|uniref:hypothetical protein n=1 Tax=Campylobacter sp. MIT 12-5580 TaxID=2040651 RepID=UPI0014850E8D|nr:hypothetical protein [Campylobacter sp. MIT 12-5580]
MITLSSFNRYFGSNPLETLTHIKNDSIQNGNPELTKEEREKLGNSFINIYKDYSELSDKVGLLEGSIEDKLRKNELSEAETNELFEWISENTTSPHWMNVNGVSYDEAYIEVFHTSKSIDEFKTKYLELQKNYSVDFSNKLNTSQGNLEKEKPLETQESDEKNQKNFTPIEGKSFNTETYKGIDTNTLLQKLLEDKFDEKDFLKMLFGIKDENVNLKSLDLNSNDLVSMLSKINLNTFNVLNKSLDVKV